MDQKIPELHDLQEVDAMLAETVQEWTKQWETKGRQEGRMEGEQIGETKILMRQLQRRFGPVPERIRETIANANSNTLETWKPGACGFLMPVL